MDIYLTLKRRIAARVIIWQSYNSIRCKLWHDTKCSSVWSVINGQLSSSNTDKLSAAQLPAANCRIPSSVINSQCDNVWKIPNQLIIEINQRYAHPFVNLPIFLSSGNRLPNVPALNLLFDYIPLNPFAPNICNSENQNHIFKPLDTAYTINKGRKKKISYLSQCLKAQISKLMTTGHF